MNEHFENRLARFKISILLTDIHTILLMQVMRIRYNITEDNIPLLVTFSLVTCLLVFTSILKRIYNLIIKCWQTITTPPFITLTIFTHVYNLWNVSVPASKRCTCFKCHHRLLLNPHLELISMDIRTLWNTDNLTKLHYFFETGIYLLLR